MRRLIAVITLLLVACTSIAAQNDAPLKIGVLAFRPKPQTLAQWQPLAAYLQSTLKLPVELTAYDHTELAAAAARRAVDVVITTPNHFVLLKQTSGLSAPLATLISHDGKHELSAYGGVIIARADRNDITSFADLSRKRIAAVSTDAFGGYQMQVFELLEAGVPLPAGDRLLLTGQPHDRVIEAVLSGRADAGFVRAGLLESLEQEGKLEPGRVKVLNRQNHPDFPYAVSTRLYPEWPVAVMPQIDREFAGRLASALFMLTHDSFAGSAAVIHGFSIPANYDDVEYLLRRLRLPPYDRAPEIRLTDLWSRYAPWIVTLSGLLLLLAGTSAGLVVIYRRSQRSLGALKESEARFRRLAENARDTIYRMSLPDGAYEYMSPAAMELFGYAPEEFYESPDIARKVIHPAWHPYFEEEWAKLLHGEMPPTYEYQIIHKSGEMRWVNQRNILVRDDVGRIVAIEGIVTDVTERKKTEAELRSLNAELELRVKERTAELEAKNADLAKMNRIFVGRELRMVELKERIRELEGGR